MRRGNPVNKAARFARNKINWIASSEFPFCGFAAQTEILPRNDGRMTNE